MNAHNADLRAWLATPDAAEFLDIGALGADDLSRWREIRTARRRRDWASSRALLNAVHTDAQVSTSLSHSHGYAAVVLADPALHVGIDIESLVPRRFLDLAGIAYSVAEARHLATLVPESLIDRFYEFWTLKEAFAKALGLSLAESLRQCRWIDDAGRMSPSIPTSRPWRATVFAPRPDLRLALTCVADHAWQLQGRIHAEEWPAPSASRWPLVLDLIGDAGTCIDATDTSPFRDL